VSPIGSNDKAPAARTFLSSTRGILPPGNGKTEGTLKMLKGRRFTPAMIVAMIALAVALSGTAVAGTTKLITGSQIANGTIKLADIHSSAKSALKGERGATGAQGPVGAQGAQGAQGPAGPQGATGAKGDKGDKGTSGLVTRHYDYIQGGGYPGAGSGGIATVACDDDPVVSQTKIAIGGGVQFLNLGRNAGTLQNAYVSETHITDSFPGRMDWTTNTPKPDRLDGWIVRLNTTPSVDMRVWVTCVDAPSAS
jgi:Collagen triple helix repeat (20 copies)